MLWRALGTAGEHAGVAADVIRQRGFLPRPQASFARVVFMSSVTLLYALHPDGGHKEQPIRLLEVAYREASDGAAPERGGRPRDTVVTYISGD